MRRSFSNICGSSENFQGYAAMLVVSLICRSKEIHSGVGMVRLGCAVVHDVVVPEVKLQPGAVAGSIITWLEFLSAPSWAAEFLIGPLQAAYLFLQKKSFGGACRFCSQPFYQPDHFPANFTAGNFTG